MAVAVGPPNAQWREALGDEAPSLLRSVYLVTISRVLAEYPGDVGFRDLEQVSRQDVARFIFDSIDNPESSSYRGGRSRQDGQSALVDRLVVYREKPK